jgi:hypothetical protein
MADARVFARLEGQMPKLLSEMRADLGEHPLVREFTLLKRCWTYCREREFQYYSKTIRNWTAWRRFSRIVG